MKRRQGQCDVCQPTLILFVTQNNEQKTNVRHQQPANSFTRFHVNLLTKYEIHWVTATAVAELCKWLEKGAVVGRRTLRGCQKQDTNIA